MSRLKNFPIGCPPDCYLQPGDGSVSRFNAVKDRHLPGQDNATVAVYQHEVATA